MGDIGEAEMEKDEYWLWLGTIPGIGNVTALKLLNAFDGDIRVLYEADKKTIAGRHIVSEKQLQSIIYSRNRDRICRAYAQMKEKGIQCLSIVDTHYPDMLKSLHDPPIVLYFLGSIPAPEEWMIALIGARQCSSYGRQVSRMLARGIAASGLTVVSGMADVPLLFLDAVLMSVIHGRILISIRRSAETAGFFPNFLRGQNRRDIIFREGIV